MLFLNLFQMRRIKFLSSFSFKNALICLYHGTLYLPVRSLRPSKSTPRCCFVVPNCSTCVYVAGEATNFTSKPTLLITAISIRVVPLGCSSYQKYIVVGSSIGITLSLFLLCRYTGIFWAAKAGIPIIPI